MAANRQQASSVASFLLGFTLVPAGLFERPSHPGLGIFLGLIGLGLVIQGLAAARRIKRLEFTNQG
jgi:hypothetical protein